MAGLKFDANGCTFSFSTGAAAGTALPGVNTVTLPGWNVDDIDDTNLDNTSVFTTIAGKLKHINALTLNVDLKAVGDLPAVGSRQQLTITLPGGVGSFVCWGHLSAISDVSLGNGTSPVVDVTFTVGNLNAAGVETAPVLTINTGNQS